MVHSGVLYKFLVDGGAPNVAGPGIDNPPPLPHPLDAPADKRCDACTDTMSGNNCIVNLNPRSVGQIAAKINIALFEIQQS